MASQSLWVSTPSIQWATGSGGILFVSGSNVARDGSGSYGANVFTVFQASASGSYVDKISIISSGTNIQSVIRFFINNGSAIATPGNNILIGEMTLASVTGRESGSMPTWEFPVQFALPPLYKINCTLYPAGITTGYSIVGYGGHYLPNS